MITIFVFTVGLVILASAAKIEEAYGYSDCGTYHDPHYYDPRPRDAPKCTLAAMEEAFKHATWTNKYWTSEWQRFTRFFCQGVSGPKMREFRQRITHRLLAWTPNVTVVRATTCYHTRAADVAEDDEVCRIRCSARSLVHEFQVESNKRPCIYAWEWPEYKTTGEFKYDKSRRITRQCE